MAAARRSARRRTCASCSRSPAAGRSRKGEVVFHRDDPADSLHLVVRGRFGARVLTPLGDSVLLDVLGPGQSFGELALLLPDARRSATVEALEDGETRSVFRDDFALLQREHPGVKDVLLRLLAEQLRRASDRSSRRTTSMPRRASAGASRRARGDVRVRRRAADAGGPRGDGRHLARDGQSRAAGGGEARRGRARSAGARPSLDASDARAPLPRGRLARQIVEQRAEQPVEALRAGDAARFSPGACGPTISGPIEIISTPGSFCAEHRALEAAVDDRERRLDAEEPRERRFARSRAAASRGRGSHGGYERRTSISAPASRAARCDRARRRRRAPAAFELRVIDAERERRRPRVAAT